MSYENAEPKILKTLNSDGQVLDDSGNVINESSDYWVQLYNQTEPKVDKILHSDGTIKDGAGNLIQDSTPFNVKKYNQSEPIPAKYLHSDGTIDENPGSGSEVKAGKISDKMKGFTKEGDELFYFVYDSEGNLLTTVNDIKTKSLGAVCRVGWSDVRVYGVESFENYFENSFEDINPIYDSESDSIVGENYPESEDFSDVSNWVPTEKLLTKLILYRYS